MSLDLSFDERVAGGYSALRAHPASVSTQIGTTIAGLVGRGSRVLEVGVGTGRIAVPVAAAGCHVVGIDLAWEMLQELASPGTGGIHRVQGNAQYLPFAENTMDAALLVHVLHLIPDWQAALKEISRVLQSGGLLIQGRDWTDPESVAGQLRQQLRLTVMALNANAKPPAAGAAISEFLASLGGTSEPPTEAANWQIRLSPAAILDGMATRADAETWALPDDLLEASMTRLTAWAAQQWPDLDASHSIARRFLLDVTRF